jgi:cation diffusion facilitator family transporter
MATGGSLRVVIFALLANLGIAAAKLVAALVTRSGAMLAEAIHSFADSGNQGLLLLGHARAARPADPNHPLGYRREAYFWALLVALILFVLGGVFSLYEGAHKLAHPAGLRDPAWALGVLGIAIALEGVSLRVAWTEYRAVRRGRPLLAWARGTGNVNLLVVVFEDLAAMGGLLLALGAVVLTVATGNPLYDALGTCLIGVLLLVVATFLASQVRRLIIGLSASAEVREGIRAVWEQHGFDVLQLLVVWDGPDHLLVATKVRPREGPGEVSALVHRINAVEDRVREAWPQVAAQFVEPDTVA